MLLFFSFHNGIFQSLGIKSVHPLHNFAIGSFRLLCIVQQDHATAVSTLFDISAQENAPLLSHFELESDFSSPDITYPHIRNQECSVTTGENIPQPKVEETYSIAMADVVHIKKVLSIHTVTSY